MKSWKFGVRRLVGAVESGDSSPAWSRQVATTKAVTSPRTPHKRGSMIANHIASPRDNIQSHAARHYFDPSDFVFLS